MASFGEGLNKKELENSFVVTKEESKENSSNNDSVSAEDILIFIFFFLMIFSYFLSFIYSLLNRRFLSGGTFFVKKELNSLNLYYLSDKISSSIFPVVYLSIMPFVFLTKYGKYPDDKTVEYMFIENFIIPDLWVNNKWSFTSVIKFSLYILSSVLNCCISRIRICGKTLFILNDNSNFNSDDSYKTINEGREEYNMSKTNQNFVIYSN